MPAPYQPPFTITPRQLTLVAEICERIGRRGGRGLSLSPQLRKANRIQSIQASLAIENNSLGIDQVTAILEGRRVMGSLREIQEVRNAIECYDQLLAGRTDLGPVYRWIFRRLQAAGADWHYAFPRLHLVDFGPSGTPADQPYDPSAAIGKEAADKERAREVARMRRQMDRDAAAAKHRERTMEPPATVRAYQDVFGKFPAGWPPDPYDPA